MTLDHMDYDTMVRVIECWERLKQIPNYEIITGTIVFQRLFEKCPSTKVLFGLPIDTNPRDSELLTTKSFQKHASQMIEMVGRALNMLGPDIELLEEILSDLGQKHILLGVKKEYFPVMGEALLEMLQETLVGDFSNKDAIAWKMVYNALSETMSSTMSGKSIVMKSWETIQCMDNYEKVVGVRLFQNFFVICPEGRSAFGLPTDIDPTSEEIVGSKRLHMHAIYFVNNLNDTFNMMEKDNWADTKHMTNLGKIHIQYGVQKEWFTKMGQALIQTLKELLKGDFTEQCEEAWIEVYNDLSSQIIQAMHVTDVSIASPKKRRSLLSSLRRQLSMKQTFSSVDNNIN